jgi:hypothetical protein
MIKGLFLVLLLVAVSNTKAAVDEKGKKKYIMSKKDLKTHISSYLSY